MNENGRRSVSIIVPVLNEESMIRKVWTAVEAALHDSATKWDLIFVDDGSKDGTWNQISLLSEEQECVSGIHFTRNFGKESAITAGLQYASGDACITMDGDLEHPPLLIRQMIETWQADPSVYVVQAIKNDRSYLPFFYRLFSAVYYWLFQLFCHIDMRNQTDFKLIDRSVRDAYLALPERNRFYRGMIAWFGYPTKDIYFDVEGQSRRSHWSTGALLRFSITTIASFSGTPLYIIAVLGAFFLLLALVFGSIALVQYFSHIAVSGFTTTILLILIQGGLMLISLSVIGLYIMKVFDEEKERPLYAILDTKNLKQR